MSYRLLPGKAYISLAFIIHGRETSSFLVDKKPSTEQRDKPHILAFLSIRNEVQTVLRSLHL